MTKRIEVYCAHVTPALARAYPVLRLPESDHSFTRQNISMVTATDDDYTLASVLQVPYSIRDEIREKTSTSADFRDGTIEYYVQYSPRATWTELAGRLYCIKCGKALAADRRFIKRTPGKCVYIPLSNSFSSR